MQERSKTKKNIKIKRAKFFRLKLLGIILFLLCLLGSLVFVFNKSQYNTFFSPSLDSSQREAQSKKTYYNEDFLIKFDIPSDWTIKKYEDKEGVEQYKLVSQDKLLEITSDIGEPKGYPEKLPPLDIKLQTNADEKNTQIEGFRDDDGKAIYFIHIGALPRQREVKFHLVIKGDLDINSQRIIPIVQTFAYTAQTPVTDDIVSYSLPEGWTTREKNPYYQMSPATDSPPIFYSADAEFTELYSLKKGAQIIIYASGEITNHNKNPLPTPQVGTTLFTKPIVIDGQKGMLIFHCYEGCSERYSINTDNYSLRVTFQCLEKCNTKEDTDRSIYAKERDYFLNSIRFKKL